MSHCRIRISVRICAALLSSCTTLVSAAEVDFYRDVYPILKTSCISCHNKTTSQSGLNLETPELIRRGGDSGPGAIPGKASESLILQAAAHQGDTVMPPKNNKAGAPNLSPADLAILTAWIEQGAKDSVQQVQALTWQPVPQGVHPIYAVALTTNGRYAACGRANQLSLYDLATRQALPRLSDEALPAISKALGSPAHRGMVYALAFSPDGTRLASGSFREVKLWKKSSRAPRIDPPRGQKFLTAAITPNGKVLAALDEHAVLQLLDPVSGVTTKTIPDLTPSDPPQLCLAPDGTKAAVRRSDGSLAIWDLSRGQLAAATTPGGNPLTVCWTRDSRSLLTGGKDQVIRCWSLADGAATEFAPPREFKGCGGAVNTIVASTISDEFLSSSSDGKLRLWSLPDGKVLREFPAPATNAIAISPDAKLLAAAVQDGSIRIWNAESGKEVIQLQGSVDSQKHLDAAQWNVAIAELDLDFSKKEVARLEAQTKTLTELLKKAEETVGREQKLLPDEQKKLDAAKGTRTAAQTDFDSIQAEASKKSDDKGLQARQTEAEKKVAAAIMAEEAAQSAVQQIRNHISDAQGEIANTTAALEQNARELPTAKEAVVSTQQQLDQAKSAFTATKDSITKEAFHPVAIAFGADSLTLAALAENGQFRAWALLTGQPVEQFSLEKVMAGSSLISPRPNVYLAVPADGSTVTFETLPNWKLDRVLGGELTDSPLADRVNTVCFSPDGRFLAAGSGEPSRTGDIVVWDVASGQLVHRWKECHADSVLSLDFSPDGSRLASGAADKVARIFDLASGEPVCAFEGHTHHVMGVSFRADGRVLATGGADESVMIWDMRSQERQKKIEGWRKEVTSVRFLGATNQILTACGDHLVRIVRDDGGQVRSIANLPEYMHAAAGDASTSLLIAGGEDGILRIWDGKNGQELIQFQQ